MSYRRLPASRLRVCNGVQRLSLGAWGGGGGAQKRASETST